MYTGGCFCGAVQYEAAAPVINCTWCHCSMCRRLCGAPSVAWFSVARAQFRYVRGKPAAYHSSPGVTREFCGTCGTHMTFADNRLHWEPICDDLPRYRRTRRDGALERA